MFDSFFSPTTIVVVSEERLKAAELKAKERQLLQVKVQLEQLQDFYSKLEGEVKALTPSDTNSVNFEVNEKHGKDLDLMDGVNCDV